ncbi:DUF6456 domain-containing protein [Rhizobium halophilum]|uniref:DUF6456 domain-containing protein n=1 Tax=Rhizobium halophilum TaxID=2846852 RepID=UPI001EFDE37B|nr:DUF6456 domain-containing protein [Rhizobium halophilum]MCF6370430.1 DUF6456 domain-containing protein [Rhizobium halophilum]
MSKMARLTEAGDFPVTSADKRNLLRLLRRVLQDPVHLKRPSDGSAGASMLGDDGRRVPHALIRHALREGLVRQNGDRLFPTPETSAFLRRALLQAEDAFAEQHRIDVEDCVEVEGVRQRARRNLAESPLSLLARLKDRSGDAFLPPQAIDAGERLLSDFTRAQLQPRVTASWEPRLSGRGKGDKGGQAEMADTAIAARERFSRAVEAMGPELAGVAVDVCCFSKGLEVVERERQWPARSAKLMLRTALLALARHYTPPSASDRKSHRWGAEGYRPPMPR